MAFVNKTQSPTGSIKIPDDVIAHGGKALQKVLSQSEGIKTALRVRLGNPTSDPEALYVPDTNNARVFISGHGDEPSFIGTMAKIGIPSNLLILGQPIKVVKNNAGNYEFWGVDTDTAESFNEGDSDSIDQVPVSQSQLDWGSLQPYQGMTAVVKGAIYGDYTVKDLTTADFSTSPLDTSSVAINIPSTANRAIGVLVQLDPATSTLSYKQSASFNAALSLSSAYALSLLPTRDTGKWRIGYVKLSNGITQLDYGSVWTCREDFPLSLRGNVGANDNRLARTDGTTGTAIQGSAVVLDDEGDMSSLTSLSFVDASELTIASGAITVLQSYHRIDTEADAASDDLDTISGGRAGMSLFLRAENTARTVVIRHIGGGSGNIRTATAASISLDETYKVVELLYDGTNWNVVSGGSGLGGSTGATDNSIIRADGTGGSTIQAGSGVTLSDAGAFSGATYSTLLNKFNWGDGTETLISASGVNSSAVGNVRNFALKANSGTTDDFLGFDGSFTNGEILWFRAFAGHTITIKHNDAAAANKLYLIGATDIVLSETSAVMVMQMTSGILGQVYYQAASSGANTALSNLASVAINTTLVSDTDNTDDLGSSANKWRAAYVNALYLEERSAPSTPSSGDLAAYVDTVGIAKAINDAGTVVTLSNVCAILRDEKSTGTAGGSSTASTWNARDLNTESYDPFAIVSIASNQLTPIAGDYKLTVWAQAGHASSGTGHRLRLYNVTGAASVEEGLSCGVPGGSVVRGTAFLTCKFTANGTDAYRIDHYTTTTQATNGLGVAVSDGSAEVYLELVLEKVG